MEPIKEFRSIELSLDNRVIPSERLMNTPSFKDGVSHELETDLRIVGCEYIQSAGLMLRLPQVAMATAQILFQRFYYVKSFVKYSIQPMAMACIFVAAKIEEDCRRLRDVINVFHHLRQKRMGRTIVPMEYMGEEYFKMKATVIKYERFLLKELGFCVHVQHPHKLVVTYLQILEMEKNAILAQRAWNFMNDCLRTNVFVRYSPETIAVACLFLAARQLQIPLPQRPPWWLAFDTDYEDIEAISLELFALYKRPKKFLENLEKTVFVLREKAKEKQIEIKEIKVKRPALTKSSQPSSPGTFSPAVPESKADRSASKSPVPAPVKSQPSNPSPIALVSQKPKQKESNPQKSSPVRNGERQSRSLSPRQRQTSGSRSPVSPPLRKLSSSSASDGEDGSRSRTRSRSRSRSRRVTPQAYKPIQSPIKLSSESQSDRSVSHSPLLPPPLSRENGLPEQYRADYEQDRRVRKSRHKHRSDKREKRRHRDRDRSVSRERQHRRRHRDRERERAYHRETQRSHERERSRRAEYRYR